MQGDERRTPLGSATDGARHELHRHPSAAELGNHVHAECVRLDPLEIAYGRRHALPHDHHGSGRPQRPVRIEVLGDEAGAVAGGQRLCQVPREQRLDLEEPGLVPPPQLAEHARPELDHGRDVVDGDGTEQEVCGALGWHRYSSTGGAPTRGV